MSNSHVSLFVQVGSQGYHVVQPLVAPHADRALRGADQMLKDYVGVNAGLSGAGDKFWA